VTRKLRTALASILALCALGAIAPAAHAATPAQTAASYLYWADWNLYSLGRMNLDGSGGNPQFVPNLLAEAPSQYGMAASDDYLYWCSWDSKTIYRTERNGAHNTIALITLSDPPQNVAVDDSHIYWAEGDAIGRADLDGGNPDPSFIGPKSINSTPINPRGVVVNDTHVYWADYARGSIGRADIDGSNPDFDLISDPTFGQPLDVAVNDTHLFWIESGANRNVGRSRLDGTEVNFELVANLLDSPVSLTASQAHLWWGASLGTIARSSVDGTGVDQGFYAISDGGVDGYPRGLDYYAGKAKPAVTVVTAGRSSLKLRVACGATPSCEVQLQGHKRGTKLLTSSRKVSIGSGRSKKVTLGYSAPLRRVMAKRGGQVAIEASNVDSGVFRSLAVRVK